MIEYHRQELEWDEQDFLECFIVSPEVEEYGISHTLDLRDDALKLTLTLWGLESFAQFTLSRAETGVLVTSFAIAIRGGIRYRNDKRGRFMEFCDCIVVPNRFYHREITDVLSGASGKFQEIRRPNADAPSPPIPGGPD